MAKVKVINKGQNQDLIGGNFTNSASETVFTLGKFSVTSNFAGRKLIDYSNSLTSFPKPITLETLSVNSDEAAAIKNITTTRTLTLLFNIIHSPFCNFN